MKTFVPPDIKRWRRGYSSATVGFVDGPMASKSGPAPFLIHYFISEWRTMYTMGMSRIT